MNIPTRPIEPPDVDYPESDGRPIAENTTQFRWIMTIQGGLDELFGDDPDVLVVGDLLWYPVEGDNTIRQAPDVFVAIGRPKGDRGSYRQWVEGGVAPQVVFEIWSPGNRPGEMQEKFDFYQRYGVEEYYVYDPFAGTLRGWRRSRGRLRAIPNMLGWTSPRLGVRFELAGKELELYRPDGRKFVSYFELAAQRAQEERQKEEARKAAEREKKRADRQTKRAEREKQRADEQTRLVEELRARLRALGEEGNP